EKRIRESDALIALMTKGEQRSDQSWRTHEWVEYEFQAARDRGIPCLALVEDGVRANPAWNAFEYVEFDRSDWSWALLSITENLVRWKQQAGRTVRVQILPDELAQAVSRDPAKYKCQYRLVMEGEPAPWQDVESVMEDGGTFVYLRRI